MRRFNKPIDKINIIFAFVGFISKVYTIRFPYLNMAKKYINDIRLRKRGYCYFWRRLCPASQCRLINSGFPITARRIISNLAVSLLLFSYLLYYLKKRQELLKTDGWSDFWQFYHHRRRRIFATPAHRVIFIIAIIPTRRRIIHWQFTANCQDEKRKLINVGLWSGLVLSFRYSAHRRHFFEVSEFGTLRWL